MKKTIDETKMTETELKKLKDLPTPRPSKQAKAAALNAARAAFAAQQVQGDQTRADQKQTDRTEGKTEPAKIIDFADKENARAARLSFKTSKRKGLKLMHILSRPTTSTIAASLLVASVSITAVMHYLPAATFKQSAPRNESGLTALSPDDRIAQRITNKLTDEAAPQKPLPMPATEAKRKDIAGEPRRTVAAPAPRADGLPLGLGKRDGAKPTSVFTPGAPPPQGYTSQGIIIAQKRFANLPTLIVPDTYGDAKPKAQNLQFSGRDKFETVKDNPVKPVKAAPVSTFSIDVDTAAYAFMRRALNAGRLPPKAAVRVEELINYFSYDYAPPETRNVPFRPIVNVLPSPWNRHNKLIHIAIKGYALQARERPRANLVLLIDVSGSMQGADRLPLLKNAFRMLVEQLKPDDTIGIVTYASGSRVVLPATKIADKGKILAAIDALGAGGSTAGAKGIRDAYALAQANFDKGAVNRIILGTDGDFNVGIANRDELKSYIERQRKSGIYLSILGVGRGNYNDALMQTLAQNGNGTAAYIDTLNEARKVLVQEASSSLFPIARDVKIQIEFNPARVKSYRLIGYETRALKREDFNNDKVDAGDVGSGHAVTAIYEITPVGAQDNLVDDLRYQTKQQRQANAKPAAKPTPAPLGLATNKFAHEYGFLKLRYKLPDQDKSRLIKLPITFEPPKDVSANAGASTAPSGSLQAAPEDVRFSIAVAAFGQLLRGGTYLGGFSYDDVIALASAAKGKDQFGSRAEFINLVRLAKSARP